MPDSTFLEASESSCRPCAVLAVLIDESACQCRQTPFKKAARSDEQEGAAKIFLPTVLPLNGGGCCG